MSLVEDAAVIASVLGMKLTVYNGEITGKVGVSFGNPTGIPMEFTVTSVSTFSEGGVGVLLHVAGDLCMIVYRLKSSGIVSVYLIDTQKFSGMGLDMPLKQLVSGSISLREIIKEIKPCIVAQFYWTGASWSTLKLP